MELAFDVGANGGMVARQLAPRFFNVVACEPAVESYERLVTDLPENVTALQVAVSAHDGEVTLRETSLTESLGELFTDDTLSWGQHVGLRTVKSRTLDSLSNAYGYPDFIKIDTEGHEVEIMEGGPETFKRKPRFVIECHSREKGNEVQRILREWDCWPFEIEYHNAYREHQPQRLEHYWVTSEGLR